MNIKKAQEYYANRITENIIRLRNGKKLSQSDLAKKMNKSRQSLQRVESGRTNPTLKHLIEISTALNVSVEYLLM